MATGARAYVHGGLSNFVLDDLYAVDLSTGAWSEVGPWIFRGHMHFAPFLFKKWISEGCISYQGACSANSGHGILA